MRNKIAIQGIKGSNHYKVVRDYVTSNNPELLCYDEFRSLCKSVEENEADFGIMAIENSIAGSILPNYRLLSEFNLHITAEYYLDIQHNLVALKGQTIKDISAVRSHQMALLQCGTFFEKHPNIKLIEDTDTALPAYQIAEHQRQHTAALVPDGTAELFGLEVIEHHIQDHNLNSTRFIKVEKQLLKDTSKINKASIKFELKHQPGALFKVLQVLNEQHINMTKIQSVPLQKSKWRYAFFLDVVFESYIVFEEVLENLKSITQNFKVLGHYKQAEI
jgi:prephenate dehydratase